MKALILTNGSYGDYAFCKRDLAVQKYDYIICADRGMTHALHLGMMPNLIVGDFDSASHEDLAYYEKMKIPVEVFDPVKDETDTEIAIRRAMAQGATSITVYGGIGSRLDHSLGNVHLIYMLLKRGIKGRLMNPNNTVYLVDQVITLQGEIGDLVSLIPFDGDVKGITTQSLGYPLTDATLMMGTSLGISNYMTQPEAQVFVKTGTLMVIQARDE